MSKKDDLIKILVESFANDFLRRYLDVYIPFKEVPTEKKQTKYCPYCGKMIDVEG